MDSEAGFDPRPGQLSAAAQVCALVREYETGAAQGDGSRASRAAARARARLPSPRPFPSSPCARSSPRIGLRSCSRLCPLPSLTARARTTRRLPRVASRRCSTRPTSAASSAATRGTARSSRSARTTRRARPRHTDGVEGAHRASFAAACAASRATTRYASTWGIDSASTNLTSRAYTSGVELRCVGRGECGGGVLGLAALFIHQAPTARRVLLHLGAASGTRTSARWQVLHQFQRVL